MIAIKSSFVILIVIEYDSWIMSSYLSLVILSAQSHHDSLCAVDTTHGYLNLGSRKSVRSISRSQLRSLTVSVDTAALRELNIRLTEIEVSINDSTEQECSVDNIDDDGASCSRKKKKLNTTSSEETRFGSKIVKHWSSNVYRCDKNRETDIAFRTELQNGTDTIHNIMLKDIESTETNDRSWRLKCRNE